MCVYQKEFFSFINIIINDFYIININLISIINDLLLDEYQKPGSIDNIIHYQYLLLNYNFTSTLNSNFPRKVLAL